MSSGSSSDGRVVTPSTESSSGCSLSQPSSDAVASQDGIQQSKPRLSSSISSLSPQQQREYHDLMKERQATLDSLRILRLAESHLKEFKDRKEK